MLWRLLVVMCIVADQCIGQSNVWLALPDTTERLSARYAHRAASCFVPDCWEPETVVFGGFADEFALTALNDTWIYYASDTSWVLSGPAKSPCPSGRGLFTMTSLLGATLGPVAILFGGQRTELNILLALGETWLFSFTSHQWTILNVTYAPTNRFGHTCVAKPKVPNVMYCYGGASAIGYVFSDFWSFDVNTETWTLLSNGTGYAFSNLYPDIENLRYVMQGLRPPNSENPFHKNTVMLSVNSSLPSPRLLHVSFVLMDVVYIAGGISVPGGCLVNNVSVYDGHCYDTWLWSDTSNSWVLVNTTVAPLPYSCVGMNAVAVSDDQAVVVGYSIAAIVDMIFTFTSNVTQEALGNTTSPPVNLWIVEAKNLAPSRVLRRFDSVCLVDFDGNSTARSEILSIAGESVNFGNWQPLNDSWTLVQDNTLFVWDEQSPPLYSPPYYDTAGVLVENVYFIFGGQSTKFPVDGELWYFKNSLWTRYYSQAALIPSPRLGTIFLHSDEPGTALLFGGADPPQGLFFSDVWQMFFTPFNESVAWEILEVNSTQRPCGRYRHAATKLDQYRMLVFGGIGIVDNATAVLGDTWIFTKTNGSLSGSWEQIQSIDASPAPRSQTLLLSRAVLTPDPVYFTFLFGGLSASNVALNDFWMHLGPFWLQINVTHITTGKPLPALYATAGVLLKNSIIIHGGKDSNAVSNVALIGIDIGRLIESDNLALLWREFLPSSLPDETPILPSPVLGIYGHQLLYVPAPDQPTRMLMYGGIARVRGSVVVPGTVGYINIGCSPGEFSKDFLLDNCQLCPFGSYAAEAGSTACTLCPQHANTTELGSISVVKCSVCENNYCNGHECKIIPASSARPVCTCKSPLYLPNGTCDSPMVLYFTLLGVFCMALILVMVYHRRRFVRTYRRFVGLSSFLQQQQRDMDQVDVQVNMRRRLTFDIGSLHARTEISRGRLGRIFTAKLHGKMCIQAYFNIGQRKITRRLLFAMQPEIALLRSFNHENLVTVYDFGVSTPDESFDLFMVAEYMQRGCLRKLLSQNLDLDALDDAIEQQLGVKAAGSHEHWQQRVRFAIDAAKGMAYLHQEFDGKTHGRLWTENMMVGVNWTVKLRFSADRFTPYIATAYQTAAQDSTTDSDSTGLLQSETSVNSYVEPVMPSFLPWVAPELLSDYPTQYKPYKSTDVYSFGICLWEIATRHIPYEDLTTELVPAVLHGLRPTIPANTWFPSAYLTLMQRCWHVTSAYRPSFPSIVKELQKLLESSME